MVVDQRVTIGFGSTNSDPVDVTKAFTVKIAGLPLEIDLPLIGGIVLAVVDAALIAYYAVTQLQKP